jgi:hypothetical protein
MITSLQTRIERYVDACPPAVSGQGGHTSTFSVAIALVCGFDLSQERALPFLRRYNERCTPPWREKELLHKIEQAENLQSQEDRPPLKPCGYLL